MAFQPALRLNGHCSVVHDSTLYIFSPDGFQALPLKKGARWKELSPGVPVQGARCVRAVPQGDPDAAALYIVGGVPTSDSPDYPGLQRFSFADQTWDTIRTTAAVATRNRQGHGAVFLSATNEILTYAGTQVPGQDPAYSSSTFLIKTEPPYLVRALTGLPAPPLLYPLVLALNESHAVMVGGDPNKNAVYTFDSRENLQQGWANLGVTLDQSIRDQDTTQCTVVTADDGSKVLEVYNLGVTPNVVTQQTLLRSQSTSAEANDLVTIPPSRSQRRALTLGSWPEYNDTLAPATTRSGYSIAEDDAGLAFITGGDGEVPLAIFDQRRNTWMDPVTIFGAQDGSIKSTGTPTATPSQSGSSTATSTSSSTAGAPAGGGDISDESENDMLTVLGATLGSIFGVAAILVVALLLLRWRRERIKRRNRAEGYANEKDRLSFADRGDEFMKEAGGFLPPEYSMTAKSDRSRSSMGIIAGLGHKRGYGPQGSDASTARLVPQKKAALGINEPVELSKMSDGSRLNTPQHPAPQIQRPPPAALTSHIPRDNSGRCRSSGWSRYFADNQATNLAQMGPGRTTYNSDDRSRSSDGSTSLYTDSRAVSHPSQQVPPLDLNFTRFDSSGSLNRVASGSPTLGHSREDLHKTGIAVSDGLKAELSRAPSRSTVSSMSTDEEDDPNFATANQADKWTPMPPSNNWDKRPPSSIYTESARGSAMPGRDPMSSYFSGALPTYHEAEGETPGYRVINSDEGRDSTVTIFPRGVPSHPSQDARGKNAGNSDMSWLNLAHGNG